MTKAQGFFQARQQNQQQCNQQQQQQQGQHPQQFQRQLNSLHQNTLQTQNSKDMSSQRGNLYQWRSQQQQQCRGSQCQTPEQARGHTKNCGVRKAPGTFNSVNSSTGGRGGLCSVHSDCPGRQSCKPTGHGCCGHAPKRCF